MSLRYRVNRFLRKFERRYATHNLIEVSRSALLHNYDLYCELTGLAVLPVIKSNAYGHGIELVARALQDRTMPYIAVDGYFEALKVREVSRQPVLIMGAIPLENIPRLRLKDFAFVVQDRATIEAFGRRGRPVKLHLDINTGMNRYGIDPAEIENFLDLIKRYPKLQLEGLMSHLADADGLDQTTVDQAIQIFDAAVETVLALGLEPKHIHIAQSAGSLKARSRYATAVRLGLGLYGINPLDPADPLYPKLAKLRPALRLTSTITRVHQLKAGDKVSYNYTFTAPRAMRIGVLPLGYYEGVQRSLSNAGTVLVGRHAAPIVGRVCMNHTMIGVKDSTAVGDKVVVLSDRPADPNSIASIAKNHNLFSYQHLTSLSPDLRRVLVD